MDETLTTAGEPQVIESANTADVNTVGYSQVLDTQVTDGGSQVVESATPMDNNVTYQNVAEDTTPSFDMNKDYSQNLIQTALQTNYQNIVAQTDGQAMTQFLDHDYDYNKSEAGTYWVAGAINDVDTQMSFLNTLVREEMYDELDLQKYYYDTTMATARAYASQKKKETAYGLYRAAQEKAIAEAQLTGWYMPAEGNYMLGQYTVAQNKLEDPDTTPEEKARAKRISGTVEKWFNANQISTRGIKCLNMMNYEENVRHNTIMGELQKEANKIAANQAGASGALAAIQLREFKFQVEELEMSWGYDFSKAIGLDNNDYIGHDINHDAEYKGLDFLQGGATPQEILKHPEYFGQIYTTRGSQWIKDTLGDKYEDFNKAWASSLGDTGLAESMKNNGFLDSSYLNKEVWKADYKEKLPDGSVIKSFHSTEPDGTSVTRVYYEDKNGVITQITDSNFKLSDGKTIGDVVSNFTDKPLMKDGKAIQIGANMNYSELGGSVTNNKAAYIYQTKAVTDAIQKQEEEGWHVVGGVYSDYKTNDAIVLRKGEAFREINAHGEVSDISKDNVIAIKAPKEKEVTDNNTGKKIKVVNFNDNNGMTSTDRNVYKEHVYKVGEYNIDGKNYGDNIKGKAGQPIPYDIVALEYGDDMHFYKEVDCDYWGKNTTTKMWQPITKDEANSLGVDVNKVTQAREDYTNGNVQSIKGLNQDSMMNQIKEEADKKKSNTPKASASGGSGGGKQESSITSNNTVEASDAEIEKIYVEMKDKPEFKDLSKEEAKEKIKKDIIYYGEFLKGEQG